jgi:hypothetical protein
VRDSASDPDGEDLLLAYTVRIEGELRSLRREQARHKSRLKLAGLGEARRAIGRSAVQAGAARD